MLAEMEMTPKEIQVDCIAPEGLGYGQGSISVNERLENPEDLRESDINKTREIIESQVSMVLINSNDDGCPDGREASAIIEGVNEERVEADLVRAKVFGGGSTMAMSAIVGNGAINPKEESLTDAFEYAIFRLEEVGLNYGGHSHVTVGEGKSGCGAIDEAPAILSNTEVYETEIADNIRALVDPEQNRAELDGMIETAMTNFKELSDSQQSESETEEPYKGGKILSKLLHRNKKIAELKGGHNEVAVVINTDMEDMTFDQEAVRKSTEGRAQVFPIDVPRLKEISQSMFEYEPDQKRAVISMLIYSLSTAATLTKGDLPVFISHQGPDRYIRL